MLRFWKIAQHHTAIQGEIALSRAKSRFESRFESPKIVLRFWAELR
jgi:hypothetical protein